MNRKTFSTLIILAAILSYFSVFMVTTYAQPVVGKTYEPDTRTVYVSENGNPIAEFQLISNTDNCFLDCEAVFRIRTSETTKLPETPGKDYSLDFFKSRTNLPGLKEYTYEVRRSRNYNVTDYSTICNPYDVTEDNGTYVVSNCTEAVTGSHTESREEYVPFAFWGETLEANTDYYIKLKGKKYASLGENNIEWVFTLNGAVLDEFAWWNSSRDTKYPISITNNNESSVLRDGFTINLSFDHANALANGYCNQTNGNDLSIVFNDDTELDRINATPFNSDSTLILFKTRNNISAGATDSTNYSIYCGSSSSITPKTDKRGVYLIYLDPDYDYGTANWTGDSTVTTETVEGMDGTSTQAWKFAGGGNCRMTRWTGTEDIDGIWEEAEINATQFSYTTRIFGIRPRLTETGCVGFTAIGLNTSDAFPDFFRDELTTSSPRDSASLGTIVTNKWYSIGIQMWNRTHNVYFSDDMTDKMPNILNATDNDDLPDTGKIGVNSYAGTMYANNLRARRYIEPFPTATAGSEELYDDPPVSQLDSPIDNYVSRTGDITFQCSATDDINLSSISLYHNISGTFSINQTDSVSGISNSTTFTINDIPDGTVFVWNCEANDTGANTAFASLNRTVTVEYEDLMFQIWNALNATIFSVDLTGNVNVTGDLNVNRTVFDSGDYMDYDTASDKYKFYIGDSVVFCINTSGGFNGDC